MQYPAYADDVSEVELGDDFSLHHVSSKAYARRWAVYRGINEDFAPSLDDQVADLDGVPFCFRIDLKGRAFGGAILLPNNVGDLFLIPPFVNPIPALAAILPLINHWSEKDRPIRAQGITTDFVDAFLHFGFEREESRRWMIRPTEPLEIDLPSQVEFNPLDPSDATEIALLLHLSFAGEPGQYGSRSPDAHLESVQRFFNSFEPDSPCGRASAKVLDIENGRVAAVILVNLHKGLPAIQFVAVHPASRRRGLATALILRALSGLESSFQWAKLAVTVGSPAEVLYRELGFQPGPQVHSLIWPAEGRH